MALPKYVHQGLMACTGRKCMHHGSINIGTRTTQLELQCCCKQDSLHILASSNPPVSIEYCFFHNSLESQDHKLEYICTCYIHTFLTLLICTHILHNIDLITNQSTCTKCLAVLFDCRYSTLYYKSILVSTNQTTILHCKLGYHTYQEIKNNLPLGGAGLCIYPGFHQVGA